MRSIVFGGTALVAATFFATVTLAGGSVPRGKAIFARTCNNCHSPQIGVNKIGPSLWDVIGRKAASVPDFNYSNALKAGSRTWDSVELDRYLSNPRGTLHGSKMYFKGLPNAQQRADVIAYLSTLK